MSGREELDRAIEAIMAAKREELGGPPTPEELLAWRDGRLDPAERQSVEARMAVHPDAARALADLAAFPDVEPAPGTPELSEDDVEARWQSLRKRMEEPEASSPAPISTNVDGGSLSREAGEGRGAPVGQGGERPRPSWPLLLAAAALLSLALGFFLGRASRPPLPEAAVNVAIAELTPVDEGGVRSPSPVELPEESEELVLVLGLLGGGEHADYEAEILAADGTRIWSGSGLRPTPLGTFHLGFRREALPPGTYRIHLFGREGGRRVQLATYELRLGGGSGHR